MKLLRMLLCVCAVSVAGDLSSGQGASYNVCDYDADPAGESLSTAAIQRAIEACARDGGGTIRFPAGTFRTGALRLRSGVTLQLDEGATLLGSRDRADYYGPAVDPNGEPTGSDTAFHHLISGVGLHDVAIRGSGRIQGAGEAFRDKKKARPKCLYFEKCRNVLIEGVRLRSAGSWMQHYRLCEKVTIRNIDVFNHVSFNNDGLNIDSCRDVTITGCRIDSDDDGIVLKSLSATPCQHVTVSDCTVSSHCNALKMGTESGGGFIDIAIHNCSVFSPKKSESIYGRQRGLAGIAMEIVDGGRMEDVRVKEIDIDGVSVPIFIRLGNRGRPYVRSNPPVGTLRDVHIANVTARNCSPIGCSITGLPGHPVEAVTLENIRLSFDGGGTLEDTQRVVREREASYPESTMFGNLPAYGVYCRHVHGLRFKNVQLRTTEPELRHAILFDDASDVKLEGLDAQRWPGAALPIRKINVRNITVH